MTKDRDMLEQCLLAFAAIPVAAKARRQLKTMGVVAEAYAGNRSHVLATEMVKRLRAHLNLETV